MWPSTSPIKIDTLVSAAGPALTYIHARREIVNAFRDGTSNVDLYSSTRSADGSWTPVRRFESDGQGSYQSAGELGLAWFQEKLYCVFRGAGSDEKLYVTVRGRDGRWSKADSSVIGGYSNSGAALAVYDDTLFCIHSGASDHDDSLWWSSTKDGAHWTKDLPFPKSYSIARPALAAIAGRLYCVHRGGRGSDGHLLHWTQLIATINGLSWAVSHALQGYFIDDGPGLATWEGDERDNPTVDAQLVQRLVCLYHTPDRLAGLKYATAKVNTETYALEWSREQSAVGFSQTSLALLTGPFPITFDR